MFGRVTYADLQFAGRKDPERSRGEEPDEGELTYENFHGSGPQEEPPRNGQGAEGQSLPRETPLRAEGPAVAQGVKPHKHQPAARTRSALVSGHQGSAGWSPRTRWAAWVVLGIGLFLLSVIVSLGVRYMQAAQQLQQASQDQATKQAGLEESQHRLRRTEQELNSTKKELNSTTEALWQSQAAKNQTRRQLQHQELLVNQANHNLTLLWREKESLIAKLKEATSCQQIGCCLQGWKLFRWKCLWISDERKDWEGSQRACQDSSSQLLILKEPWDAHDVWPPASPEQSERFWIGLKKSRNSFSWVDQSSGLGTSVRESPGYKSGCVDLHGGGLNWRSCSEKKRFICEKPALKVKSAFSFQRLRRSWLSLPARKSPRSSLRLLRHPILPPSGARHQDVNRGLHLST